LSRRRSSAGADARRRRLGGWIPGSLAGGVLLADREQTIIALCIYGFIAAVLPVWLLLTPRDYLSSFLKIGTVALLVVA
jgi:carbon starvation protein